MNLGIAERFTITTPLSMKEVQIRLASVVEPPQRRLFTNYSTWKRKPYEGIVSDINFEIRRVINYRNSFLPNIEGKMRDREGTTDIEVSMDMSSFALAFMSFWLVGVFLFGLCGSWGSLGQGSFSWSNMIPLIMLIFGIAMTVGGFQFEAQKSKAFLYSLFATDQPSAEKNA